MTLAVWSRSSSTGRTLQGELLLDVEAERDPEDAPLFVVRDVGGVTYRLVNVARWRFLDEPGAAPWPLSADGDLARAALELRRRVRYLEVELREAMQPLVRRFIDQTGLVPGQLTIELVDVATPGSDTPDVRIEVRAIVPL